MDALTLLNIGLALVNLLVAAFQGWKEWRTRALGPHPLEPALHQMAQAIDDLTDVVRMKKFP